VATRSGGTWNVYGTLSVRHFGTCENLCREVKLTKIESVECPFIVGREGYSIVRYGGAEAKELHIVRPKRVSGHEAMLWPLV
jgi:hypothetical protein